jgi:hypothetical protein
MPVIKAEFFEAFQSDKIFSEQPREAIKEAIPRERMAKHFRVQILGWLDTRYARVPVRTTAPC